MNYNEAIDPAARVTVRTAIAEIRDHGHDARVDMRPDGRFELFADSGDGFERVTVCNRDASISTAAVMAWLGY